MQSLSKSPIQTLITQSNHRTDSKEQARHLLTTIIEQQ